MKKINRIIQGWKKSFLKYIGYLPEEETQFYNARYWTCLNCSHKSFGICTLCGCPVSKKSYSPSEWCPDNRWYPHLYSPDSIKIDEITPLLRNKFRLWLQEKMYKESEGSIPSRIWEEFLETL